MKTLAKLTAVLVALVTLSLVTPTAYAHPEWTQADTTLKLKSNKRVQKWYDRATSGPEAGTDLTTLTCTWTQNFYSSGTSLYPTDAVYETTLQVSSAEYYGFFNQNVDDHDISRRIEFSQVNQYGFFTRAHEVVTRVVANQVVVSDYTYTDLTDIQTLWGAYGFSSTSQVYSKCARGTTGQYTVAGTSTTANCVLFERNTYSNSIEVTLGTLVWSPTTQYQVRSAEAGTPMSNPLWTVGFNLSLNQLGGSTRSLNNRAPYNAREPLVDNTFSEANTTAGSTIVVWLPQ